MSFLSGQDFFGNAMQLQQPPLVPILGYGAIGQDQSIITLSGQRQPQTSGASAIASASLPTLSSNLTLQQQLQRVEMAREKLLIQIQEILRETSDFQTSGFGKLMRKDMMIRRTPTSPTNTSDTAQSNHSNIDPFPGADSDFHSRQERGDSGLGTSTNYSLPHTPEDYLMGMDEGAEDVLLGIAELNLEPIPGTTLDMVYRKS